MLDFFESQCYTMLVELLPRLLKRLSSVWLFFQLFRTLHKNDKITRRRLAMYKSYSMELAGRTLSVDIGRVSAQANAAAFMHYGETTVLSTITASKEPREGIDFFPLSVEYEIGRASCRERV